MCGLNSRYAVLPVKKKLHCHNVYFLYKGNCKGSQKEDENMESCKESMHIRGKAAYFLLYTVQIMLLMGFFNTLLLLTRDLLWKRTLSSKTKLSDRSSLDFPTIVCNMSNFRLGAWSWSANVDLHAFFNFLSH